MDISPARRRLIFGLIVCALAGLGAYLIGPDAHGAGSPPKRHAAHAPSAAHRSAGTVNAASGQPDIYQWLPFTRAGLAAAALVVVKFGDAYGSYSYTQNGAAYVAPLVPFTSGPLVNQIEAAYAVPGVVATRVGSKQVSVGTTTIGSIRAFGPSSLTFLIRLSQHVTDKAGQSQQSTVYAVTVTGSGTSWQVADVELASAGNS